MNKSIRVIRKYERIKRPPVKGTLVGVRLQPPELAQLDEWIAAQNEPTSRPEAMRMLMTLALARKRK